MKVAELSDRVRIVTMFAALAITLWVYPKGEFQAEEGLAVEKLLGLFFVPGLLLAWSALPIDWHRLISRPAVLVVFSGLAGVCLGVEVAWALVSIIVWFLWYGDPANGQLEPLFVAFGIATGAMELTRRSVERVLSNHGDSTTTQRP